MWHLKTKLGTFWVMPVTEADSQCYLGIDDHQLGVFRDPNDAIKNVTEQNTGHLQWDCLSRAKAPQHLDKWSKGSPEEWIGD